MSSDPKDSRSPSEYDREIQPRRVRRAAEPLHEDPRGIHGVTIASIQHDFAAKLTALNDRNVRLVGQAVSLNDPRDIAAHITNLASFALINGLTEDTVNAIGAQAIALKMAFARVETMRVDTGTDSAA